MRLPRYTLLKSVFVLWVANAVISLAIGLPLARGRALGGALPAIHFWLAFVSHFALLQGLAAALFAVAVILLPRRWMLLGIIPAAWGFLLFVLYLDRAIYSLYRFHINASVVSLLTTPGVGDNLQFSPWLVASFVGALAALIAIDAVLARCALRWLSADPPRLRVSPRRVTAYAALLLAAVAVDKAVYAAADLRSIREVLVNVRVIPFYRPMTLKSWASRFGVQVNRVQRLDSGIDLRYPTAPVTAPVNPTGLNVLWILIEGLRFDMFDPATTPNLCAFSNRAVVGGRHYSSGNATRCAVFGLFYGMQGSYWHPFLANRQGPVFLRLLRDMGYDLLAMGSAGFSNPEFRQTCFAGLPPESLRDEYDGDVTDKDLAMSRDLHAYLAARPANRPFFCFAFFDSSHAYRFKRLPGFEPPEPVDDEPFTDYPRLPKDEALRRRTFARYRNSLAYVDFLLRDTLQALKDRDLLKNTIVMIAGDHGEEFGENGFYGHNNAFDGWQTRTAFVFYYPGCRPGRIQRMTSHADVVPTVMNLLGATAPTDVYTQGIDMFGTTERDHVVAASWSDLAVIARDESTVVFSLGGYNPSTLDVFDGAYRPVSDRNAILKRMAPAIDGVLKGSRQFKQ